MANWRTNTLLAFLCGLVVLLPILAMPLGQDQATFFSGGRTMLEGGLLYVDFIDVKPPLLYLIYGAGGMLLGSTAFAIRLFDFLWQGATLGLLIVFLQSRGVSKMWLWCTTLTYALLYTTLGHSPTAQAETVFALPLIGTLLLVDQRSTWGRDVLLGLLCGVAFLLKYPLAIIGPASVLLFLVRGDGWKSATVSMFRIALGATALIAAIVWPMIADPRFAPAFADIVTYLKVYTSNVGWNLGLITFGLKETGTFVGNNISLLVSIGVVIGLLSSSKRLITTSTLFALLLIVSIIIERKFQPYHFARLYVPVSIIAGLGLQVLFAHGRRMFADASLFPRLTLAGSALVLVLFSPMPRFVNVSRLAVATIFNSDAYNAYLTRSELSGFNYEAISHLRTDLDRRLMPEDKVMIVSLMATPIVPFLPTRHVGPFADAHFYHGVGATPTWHARAQDQMETANWVVIDTIDKCTGMTLHPYTSWQALQRDSILWQTLQDHFHSVDTVDCFFIYQRNP